MPFQSLKASFSVCSQLETDTNILRANPDFHRKPRYDYALVKVQGDQCIFVQILYMLRIKYNNEEYHMALVLPFDVPRAAINRRRDNEMRFTRVHPRARSASLFIDTNSIIRGALLAKDGLSNEGDYLVVNFIDQDMWMRLQTLKLIYHAKI